MSEQEKEWLRHGERGISSEAIFSQLSGVPILEDRSGFGDTPCDPDDFRRCELLLNAVPEYRKRLPEMAERSPLWGKLVENWQLVVDCFDEECPEWRGNHSWSAPKTYDLMKKLGL